MSLLIRRAANVDHEWQIHDIVSVGRKNAFTHDCPPDEFTLLQAAKFQQPHDGNREE